MGPRTVRLYQRDSFLTRFRAVVVDVRPSPAGEAGAPPRFDLVLDRTAFYPEGGGQPSDTGRLAGLPVLAVREGDEGPLHTISAELSGAALPKAGDEVEGVVDWVRRHDHMQQHSGQHLLSRAFLDVAAARTRSFHLGTEICTIDIAMSSPDAGAIGRAAALTNAIIAADRPVAVSERDAVGIDAAEEAGLSGLKLKPGDPVRIIEVDGFDATPCGGTHVARTGQVGPVALLGHEPFRGMTRITFACGRRVARLLEESTARLNACVALLSAPAPEVEEALRRLVADKEALHRQVRRLTSDLAAREAEVEAAGAPRAGSWLLLRKTLSAPDRSLDEALALVKSFAAAPGRLALVTFVDGGKATLIASRSEGGGPSLGSIVSRAAAAAGGKGGGSPLHARAGGLSAAAAESVAESVLAALGGGAG